MGRGMGEKARGAYILRMLVNSPPLQELALAVVPIQPLNPTPASQWKDRRIKSQVLALALALVL